MGSLVPFRRKARPPSPKGKAAPAHWRGSNVRRAKPRGSWGEAPRQMRPVFLLIALATVWAIWDDPARIGAPDLLATDAARIDRHFPLCTDTGYARDCVVDGDTFEYGGERIRVLGIDTAEMDAACEAEAVLARQSALALQDWLNRGAFAMQGKWGEDRDRYGRLLRTLWRSRADGSRDEAALYMRERGGARDYGGEGRAEWC